MLCGQRHGRVVDLVVVGQATARDCAGVKGRFTRRGRVARLGSPIDLLLVSVFFELDVDFDLLVAFDVVGHARSVPVDGSCETRDRFEFLRRVELAGPSCDFSSLW